VNLLNYGKTWEIIKNQDLLHKQKDTSSFLKIELGRIEENTELIKNVRGYGTHLSFDLESVKIANSV